jgi:hypothetical protein
VLTDAGQRWNVAPGYLRRAADARHPALSKGQIFRLLEE